VYRTASNGSHYAKLREERICRGGQSFGKSRHWKENANMHFVPAVSVEALLAGLQACGVDTVKIRKLVGLAPRYADPAEQLPNSVWDRIWLEAAKLDPRAELPAMAATRVPFGLFGALDYLAGSAQTVRGGLQALADHFSAASAGIELELHFDEPDGGKNLNDCFCRGSRIFPPSH
jgi:hypothetical protein